MLINRNTLGLQRNDGSNNDGNNQLDENGSGTETIWKNHNLFYFRLRQQK
jgi:hypothetical protein